MEETKYVPSAQVEAAKRVMEAQREAKPEYQSAWEQQLQRAMEQILNRERFRYDLNGDALYRQYREQAVRNGRLAMMDSMAQAAAMTGGYGNSYAQSVGQQAYQQELAELGDRIPELYALAVQQYQMQSQQLKERYDLLYGRENRDYSRYQDALTAWQQEGNRLWNRYTDARDYDYGAFRDSVTDAQWQAKFDEDKRRYDQQWEIDHPVQSGASSSSKVVYKTVTKKEPEKQTTTAVDSGPRVVLL